jgi:hypothetical protein
MPAQTKYFVARKFLEGLVFSALILVVFLHFWSVAAYATLGALVALILAWSELKGAKLFDYVLYPVVAALNVALWPAMVYNNITRRRTG